MKLLFTVWISAVLTQEVFSSALVRYPRHAVSKPTSSVHTEYEAIYEQKGKHCNGSYSTVSGKQEVVHDNCHDNWNAFADKCATLIKDLVASLGNAVSSKPGDATNLQLRIRNTFKHFDSTDNCTCFTKNSLTSLFDNITASTAHPVVVHQEIIPSAQNDNGNSGQVQSRTCQRESFNEEIGSGQKVLSSSQQRRGQPSLTLTNAEDVDPENADTSKESSTTNSRRGVQYPAIIVKDPSQRSRGSGAAVSESKQSSPISGSSSNTKKTLSPAVGTSQSAPAPAKTPAEIVVPTSQSQGSTNAQPLKSTTSSRTSVPQQSSSQSASPVYHPAKNNGIVKSAIPVRSSSSAAKISPPEAAVIKSSSASNDAASGSGQATGVLSDAKTPLGVPVKPVEEVVPVNGEETPTESNASSNRTPVTVPVVLTEPVNSAVSKPQSDSSVSSVAANGASGRIPSVGSESEPLSGVLAEPETISNKSEGDKDEDFDEEEGSEDPESVLTPIVPVAEPVSGTAGDSISDTAVEPVSVPVAEPGTIPIKSEGVEEDSDEEKGSEDPESVLTPIVPVAEPVSGTAGDSISDTAVEPVAVAEPVSGTAGDSISDTAVEPVAVAEPVSGTAGDSISDTAVEPVAVAEPVSGTAGDSISDTAVEPVSVPVAEQVSGIAGDSISDTAVEPVAVAEPVSGTAGDSISDTAVEPVSVPVAEPGTIPIKSEGVEEDSDEEKGSEDPESVLTPIVPVAEPVGDTAGDSISDTAVEPVAVAEPVGDTAGDSISDTAVEPVAVAEPVGDTAGDSISDTAVEPVAVAEPVGGTTGDSISDTAVEPVSVPVAEPGTIPIKSQRDKDEDSDEEEGSESEQIPVVPRVTSAAEPQLTSTNDEGDSKDEGAAGNGSNQRPVVKPVTSTVVSDRNAKSASNPKSSVPAVPVSDSGDSEMPVISRAADSTNQESLSISDDPVPPEIASTSNTANINPGLVVKQPQSQHSAQKTPSAEVPLINSNSNLPDSTGAVDSAGTVNPSPIYQSLPPSATPSSDSAVISNKPQQSTNKQEVSKPLANERDKSTQSGARQSISSMKGIPVAPAAASQRSKGKGGKDAGEKVFIVTPVPVYPEKVIVKPAEPVEESSKNGSPSKGSELTGVAHTKPAKSGGASGPAVDTLQAGNTRQENLPTTPIPVIPVVTKEHNGGAAEHSASGRPSLQQHPLFTNLGNKKSAGNQPKQITGESVVLRPQSPPVPAVHTAEDEDLTKPTTFQTTSTDPTPPQQSIQSPPLKNSVSLTRPTSGPQDSFETPQGAPATSPQTPHDDDDDDEEDCCSCESCTEEEVTNPKQYKEMACKDLEEARKELKAIFDKIKKRLKCGKKAPQKIVAS